MVSGDSPAQPGGPLAGLTAGSRVAGYLLEKLVGVGGMAAVFRARDERLGRVVALKLLAGDEEVRKRFVREARAVAAVDHPHIIPVYEAGEAAGVLFIAMRFVAVVGFIQFDRERKGELGGGDPQLGGDLDPGSPLRKSETVDLVEEVRFHIG